MKRRLAKRFRRGSAWQRKSVMQQIQSIVSQNVCDLSYLIPSGIALTYQGDGFSCFFAWNIARSWYAALSGKLTSQEMRRKRQKQDTSSFQEKSPPCLDTNPI
jgi:hypothetical protein